MWKTGSDFKIKKFPCETSKKLVYQLDKYGYKNDSKMYNGVKAI